MVDPSLVLATLSKRYPQPKTNLIASNPFELLVATILSAQCTDARVNQLTPALFAAWPNPKAMSEADQGALEEVIRPAGFYRMKAKHLLATAKRLETTFQGTVPKTLEELLTLPGVARKTANVVLYGAYGINAGFAVDTHVKRISTRLGLTKEQDPNRIEEDLVRLFPQESWGDLNHRMVWFGREICCARSPKCHSCPFGESCPRLGLEGSAKSG